MKTSVFLLLSFLLVGGGTAVRAATNPQVGDVAPNFTLQTLDEKPVELKELTAKSRVVLVVLRGWPGYQCPVCASQVRDFVARANDFATAGAQVLMVYPGPANELKAHASDFLRDKQWPANFIFVLDSDYTFTNAYGLRWNAKNETAYPSTFVIRTDGTIQFAQISKTHGGRVSVARALAELK